MSDFIDDKHIEEAETEFQEVGIGEGAGRLRQIICGALFTLHPVVAIAQAYANASRINHSNNPYAKALAATALAGVSIGSIMSQSEHELVKSIGLSIWGGSAILTVFNGGMVREYEEEYDIEPDDDDPERYSLDNHNDNGTEAVLLSRAA